MNSQTLLKNRTYNHNFHSPNNLAKKGTLQAMIFTLIMMIVEIIGGMYYGSMALLADGWHMSSHALALGLAFFAYAMANKYANDVKFNFGTFKIEILAAFTSAIFLLGIAFFMIYESISRLINPTIIAYKEAIIIALIGLVVNLICAYLLRGEHSHDHTHEHSHPNDLNLKAAYIHVITDAMTSVFAIIALIAGLVFGATWLDPLMGIVGSILIFIWAVSLIKRSSKILLDANMNDEIVNEVLEILTSKKYNNLNLEDLHILQVAGDKYACIISVSSDELVDIKEIKNDLLIHEELVHIIIEVK
ncbi:cation diffusion facilitator family transporter [Campylobacter iguaniorum]|uniref:Cation diffusion facilitator family transporter n=1 Tax=Campylobacter iguaniorum TaxID=1244531 RepID=A0A076FAX2_9BACT|nr:CDF family Co(II)/Ni(II) efflux transporter DmeF [Campylobacter iguaniorum]AII15151.1 cation diffusion facilitator family transporter [Campylobacter iguaniorum]ALV25019.1 cation diffusion facilitator family transporter [Campylobacter iguaniorum]